LTAFVSIATISKERQATLFALAAVLCWSTVATAFKLGLEVLTPSQLLLQGVVFSTLVFVTANSVAGSWRLSRRLVLQAAGLGLLNPFAYYQVLFAAYDRLPAQLAQSVNYTWAIMLAVMAVPLLGQRLGVRGLAGIAVSYGGVLIIVLGVEAHGELEWAWSGLALALGSTVVWALYWIINARSDAEPLPLMTWSFVFATPAVAAVCAATDGLPEWTGATVPFGLWVGVVEMGVTFLLWSAALRRTVHAARIGQLIFLAPFLSLLLIERVLGEPVPPSSWIGLGVIVSGLLITGQGSKRLSPVRRVGSP